MQTVLDERETAFQSALSDLHYRTMARLEEINERLRSITGDFYLTNETTTPAGAEEAA